MHRLVFWGFAIALVPLSIAVVWETVVGVRALLAQTSRKERGSRAQSLINDGPQG
jgi:hypothetical protein